LPAIRQVGRQVVRGNATESLEAEIIESVCDTLDRQSALRFRVAANGQNSLGFAVPSRWIRRHGHRPGKEATIESRNEFHPGRVKKQHVLPAAPASVSFVATARDFRSNCS
jgi:hypothetical protein